MKNKYERETGFQTTFVMGTGRRGKEIAELFEETTEKLEASGARTLRVSVRVLAKLGLTHPVVKEALIQEPE